MASDGNPGSIAVVSPVIGSQAPAPNKFQPAGGNALPQGGKTATPTAAAVLPPVGDGKKTAPVSSEAKNTAPVSNDAKSAAAVPNQAKGTTVSRSDPQALVDQINKYVNDSGLPDQYRLDPASANYIQQVNPATGAVIAQYSVSEFPALALSVGATSLLIDETA
jgi:hypothetical protein